VVLVVSVLFALAGPPVGGRLPPAPATRILVCGGLAVAVATGFVCSVAAFTLLGQLPRVAHLGHWSAQAVHDGSPVPVAVAVGGGLLVVPAAGHALLVLVRRLAAFTRVELACSGCRGAGPDDLVVVDSPRAEAFTTPGWSGRIVVTTGLMRGLAASERRAVLEHERSHLRHHHAWWLLAVDLAAAANPLLRSTARTVAHTVERWADEDAADALADRRVVARAVGRAALLHQAGSVTPALSALGGEVPARVRALLAPRPRRRLRYLAAPLVLIALVTGATALVQERGRELFVHAAVVLRDH
jgi:hypothetical protein